MQKNSLKNKEIYFDSCSDCHDEKRDDNIEKVNFIIKTQMKNLLIWVNNLLNYISNNIDRYTY